jgi:NAD(P)-dependent dehydrogenase (short-subunit alcohol dehydrogenase family)
MKLTQTLPHKLFDLAGRVAFVSGAAGHLGSALSEGLATAGAHVILNGRNAAKLEMLATHLRKLDCAVTVAAFDITDEVALHAAFGEIQASHGRLDILVNNAYAGYPGTVENSTAEEFRKTYEIGVISAFTSVQAALPGMRAAVSRTGGASIINIASIYGRVSPDPRLYGDSGMNNPPYYGGAKGGLLQLTRYLACHLAPQGIRCNSISPGPFPPDSVAPDFAARLVEKVPLGRLGRSADLVGALLLLASDAGAYINGAEIPVDGGWTAW